MRLDRHVIALSGSAAQTRAQAERAVGRLDPGQVLWLGPAKAVKSLGQTFDAVVLSLHEALDLDELARSQGFIRAGGVLILRMDEAPPPAHGLAVHPFTPAQVGTRTWERLRRFLREGQGTVVVSPREWAPPPRDPQGNEAQARVVEVLVDSLGEAGRAVVLTGARGRGKSAALGMALQAWLARGPGRVAVTGVAPRAAGEVFRFGLGAVAPPERGPVRWVEVDRLLDGEEESPDVLLVDEAAALGLPTLQALVRAHPASCVVFCTTTSGYEGSGRGFLLKLLPWLRGVREVRELQLTAPIRWGASDPLEAWIHRLLLLDVAPEAEGVGRAEPTVSQLDRDRLVREEGLLRGLFGLLMRAHYRTTPADLYRLLDAPNLSIHALEAEGRVMGACLVAEEGGLPPLQIQAMAEGRARIRGHALPDTLICHSGEVEAGGLRMIRSVRTVVHPALHGRGLGRRLVEDVHLRWAPDLFGTVFGATVSLVRFRRALGYEVVRVGGSRGARTGAPSVVMIRPVSAAARELVARLRVALARSLPLQGRLLQAEGPLEPGLLEVLAEGLPDVEPWPREARESTLNAYLRGVRTYDAAAVAVREWVEERGHLLGRLSAQERGLIEARVLHERAWRQVARAAGMPTVNAAMRGLRRALRALREVREAEAG